MSQMMTSLADFKRAMKVGRTVTLVECDNPKHRFLNVARTIGTVNTVGFELRADPEEVGSYCDWPKAKELQFFPEDPLRVRINHSFGYLVYQLGKED